MYSAKCDNCGKRWSDEEMGYCAFTDCCSMEDNVNNDVSWHGEKGKHYCGNCWKFDDEDNLILTPSNYVATEPSPFASIKSSLLSILAKNKAFDAQRSGPEEMVAVGMVSELVKDIKNLIETI